MHNWRRLERRRELENARAGIIAEVAFRPSRQLDQLAAMRDEKAVVAFLPAETPT
jgi:hypothetical protein